MEWYGAKTLYLWSTDEEPKNKDAEYIDDGFGLEERIVLLKANSFDEAIILAEQEAKEYEKSWVNKYGQPVTIKYLEACDVYKMPSNPNEKTEAFSMVSKFEGKPDIAELESMRFGYEIDEETEAKISSKIAGPKNH